MKKVLIYVLLIAIVIAGGIFVAKKIAKDDTTKPVSQENVERNETKNNLNNTTNTNINNDVVNENNNIQNNETDDNETKPNEDPVQTATTDEEKAIAIAKKEWGNDSGVNFVFDHKNENGEFVIAVRDSNTTAAIEWYTVNVQEGTCKSR